jgi:hypothetical protein
MDHPLLTVVWVAGPADPFLAAHGSTFTAHGIRFSLADVNSRLTQGADLRVLPTWALADAHVYQAQYEQHSRPTLLLGRTADEVPELLEIALDDDEVGHAQEPLATLVERLRRVQRFSAPAEGRQRPVAQNRICRSIWPARCPALVRGRVHLDITAIAANGIGTLIPAGGGSAAGAAERQ